jgi:hypothetical protein
LRRPVSSNGLLFRRDDSPWRCPAHWKSRRNSRLSFDEELDQDHEVGMKLVTYGQAVTIHVTKLGFFNPSLIMFFGDTEDGDRVQLIQHVSQISFLLVALPKLNPDEPKRPFGFEQCVQPTENENAPAG